MKTYKKISLGLFFLFIVFASNLILHNTRVGAAGFPLPIHAANVPYTKVEYWQACAYKVAFNATGGVLDICNLNSGPGGTNTFNYGSANTSSLSNSAFPQQTYQTSYGPTPPKMISLLNSSGQPLVTATSTAESLAWNNVSYTGQSYTAGTTGQTDAVKFYVYQPAAGAPSGSNYSFLASMNPNGSLQVLALVYNVTTNNKVFAVAIDKAAVGSTATGGLCVAGSTAPTCGPVSSVAPTAADSSCEASTNFSLSWLMCPLFDAATSLTNSLINLFEGELSFTVSKDLGSPNCKVNSQSCQNSVKTTWGLIKNISSVVLVVIMLMMVIAQAIGGGPFDAYTIRKLLPKLVAAVILMQLSWPLMSWVFDLVNDVGKGLQDLLYAPFGGSSSLNDLGKLLQHAGIDKTQAVALNYVGIIALAVSAVAALPTALFLAFAAVLGFLTALVVLIFRKVLIIMLLILSPLAFVAWILPGTQRYWKLWLDNLTKVLAMFPLVVAMVAAGRIFAYVAGQQPNSFLALIFVLVGYIGPLFILPKTFKWGGGIMSAAGGAITNASARINKGMEQPIKGLGERQQGKWAKQYNPEAGLGSRVLKRVQSGHVLPTKRSQRLAIAAGDKWQSERDDEALALINRKGEKAREGYKTALRDQNGNYLKYLRNERGQLLTAKGKVTENEDEAKKVSANGSEDADYRTLQGVAAMKQMWVDLAENGRDDHEKKMAVKKLISTSSWPEIQGSYTSGGKKVIDTDAWRNAVTTSEDDYPRVLRSRVDAAPHILDAANKAAADAGFTTDSAEARQFKSAYRINYAIEKQMSNEDFQTQSDGFWSEVNQMANLRDANGNLTKEATQIRTNLRARLQAIRDIGGTAPQQLLGHLASGGSLEKDVSEALGDDLTIRSFIPGSKPAAPEPGVTTESGRTYETGNVAGGQRTSTISRENIQNMTEENVRNWIRNVGGDEGVSGMSNQDLTVIYNARRDAVQQAAREELERRGLFNPAGPNLPPDVEPPSAPPAPTSPGPASGGPGELQVEHDDSPPRTPGTVVEPEDFGPEGRFPPPNIPPGPGNR